MNFSITANITDEKRHTYGHILRCDPYVELDTKEKALDAFSHAKKLIHQDIQEEMKNSSYLLKMYLVKRNVKINLLLLDSNGNIIKQESFYYSCYFE